MLTRQRDFRFKFRFFYGFHNLNTTTQSATYILKRTTSAACPSFNQLEKATGTKYIRELCYGINQRYTRRLQPTPP